jgi:transaldolase
MAVFLDTGNIAEIKRFLRMGVIRGVTTNPTILRREGLSGGVKALKKLETAIARLIHPLPLSVEVTSNRREEMVSQAREFASWAENINVKIPIHGPEGEPENLEAVHLLETKHNIRVNVTALMSAQQGILAALSGATYVSLFGGRINDLGHDASGEIADLRSLLDRLELKAKIIVGSTREVANVVDWLASGADIVTVTPSLLEKMIVHPYTKETVRMFLEDARKSQ